MEKRILPYLVVISAISVSLSAAFYSVTGIGKMFAGSSTNVMIMMASLEIAKLVLASLLFQYWDRFNIALKSYYFVAIFTLMVITSGGIYGYLSAAYSETSVKLELENKSLDNINTNKSYVNQTISETQIEIDMRTDRIRNLTENRQRQESRQDSLISKGYSTSAKNVEKSIQRDIDEINKLLGEVTFLRESVKSLKDTLRAYDEEILIVKKESEVTGEIGPLKYISSLTGKPIDVVVNWFIIALMLVFDPLAVSLVVGANVIFRDKEKEINKKKIVESIDKKISDFETIEKEFNDRSQEFSEKLSEIEKSELELNSRIQEKEEILKSKESELETILKKKEEELISKLKEEEEEFNQKIKTSQKKLDELKKEEESIKNRISSEEYRIAKMEDDILKEKENLLKEREELEEDKEDFNNRYSNIDESMEELRIKENEIESMKEELMALDKEIKEWESTHWRLRRGKKPPSAI
jgi:chromosome segregation ATPase